VDEFFRVTRKRWTAVAISWAAALESAHAQLHHHAFHPPVACRRIQPQSTTSMTVTRLGVRKLPEMPAAVRRSAP